MSDKLPASSPMTIVHLIATLDVGGAEMMLYKLVAAMDRRRFRNVVVSLTDIGAVGKRIEAADVPVHALHMPRGRPHLKGLNSLSRLLQEERPAILQTWMYHANLLGTLVRRRAKVPHLVWNMRSANQDLRLYPRLTRLTLHACAKLSRYPSVVVVNSEAGRTVHSDLGFHPRRWEVIPNGFDLTHFAPGHAARESVRTELGLPPDSILIGVVGRYHLMKGHETFLRAAIHLARDHSDVHFLLIGHGLEATNSALTEVIGGHEVAKNVHLLGGRSDVPRLMAAMDIFANSSLSEGFPNVVGEAMACGVPCVVTDVGDSAIIVGDCGIVVPPNNAEALAHGWEQLIEAGVEARRRLGHAARRRIEENYSLERIVQQYEELYSSLNTA